MSLAAMYALTMTPPDPNAADHLRDLAKAIGSTCRQPDCAEPAKAKGLCATHYKRKARTARRCPQCDAPLIRHRDEHPSRFKARVYCSKRCASKAGHAKQAEKAQERYASLIEDVEWLLGTDSPHRIAARLGYDNPASLERRLERAGRSDLASHFHDMSAAA